MSILSGNTSYIILAINRLYLYTKYIQYVSCIFEKLANLTLFINPTNQLFLHWKEYF